MVLQGKVAIVTGTAGGFSAELSRVYAREGANGTLFLTWDRSSFPTGLE